MESGPTPYDPYLYLQAFRCLARLYPGLYEFWYRAMVQACRQDQDLESLLDSAWEVAFWTNSVGMTHSARHIFHREPSAVSWYPSTAVLAHL